MNGSENVVDWNSKMEGNGQALLRIAALLFGFALLAERLVGQSAPVRLLVLAILRSAESVAREFVTGRTDIGHSTYPPGRVSDDTAEATRLARSFRALASALDVLCSIVACTVRCPTNGDIARDAARVCHRVRPILGLPHRAVARDVPRAPDTS